MTAVLQSPSHLPSPPSSSLSCSANDGSRQTRPVLNEDDPPTATEGEGEDLEGEGEGEGRGSSVVKGRGGERDEQLDGEEEESNQLSLFALLLTLFRRSLVGCSTERDKDNRSMEIGWPTEVRHVAHVTFDRFHGFLGLPVEFEPEVPRRAPSASTTVFGVSTESMQCSYDSRGNSVPTILLMMQRRLYAQGGLLSEGVFRITADNTQEEHVRDQLNSGIIPDGIDVHCLAGLIKAWFRELPNGVLDSLTPEQVLECQSEEDYVQLVRLLPSTESALLDWAVNLMADVVQEEHHNKMNAHNVATVFAPNMTQMADPLTALMHAVQVMNLLKTLIVRALRERQEPVIDGACASHSEPSDENDHDSPLRLPTEACTEGETEQETEQPSVSNEFVVDNPSDLPEDNLTAADAPDTSDIAPKNSSSEVIGWSTDDQPCKVLAQIDNSTNGSETAGIQAGSRRKKSGRPSNFNLKKAPKRTNGKPVVKAPVLTEKSKGICTLSRLSSRVERVEAWR